MKLIHGDCLEEMPKLDENSVDTIITDSPYGLDFMGKDWDQGVPGVAFWEAALRVAKPGAMLFAFGGTRTVHRLTCAIEDAGWIIRDRMQWIYGSGFPKSHNISKAIDKAAGAEREVVGKVERWGANASGGRGNQKGNSYQASEIGAKKIDDITAPATPAAELWDGYGTALKPAHEPIIVAMKPLEGTFAENAIKWGVAGLWIDGGRVGDEEIKINTYQDRNFNWGIGTSGDGAEYKGETHNGRWPANILHDGSDEVLKGFPQTNSGAILPHHKTHESENRAMSGKNYARGPQNSPASYGSAARFFYCAKASKSERNQGLEGMEAKESGVKNKSGRGFSESDPYRKITNQNHHPTVKPLALMRYLCRLSRTPFGGVVLDPFAGSFTTGVAAVMEGRDFIGMDMDADYIEIGKKRIAAAQPALF